MIIVKLQGGLGNQMFQFAAGLALAKKHVADLYLDLSFFNDNKSLQPITPRDFELDIFELPAQALTVVQKKKILKNKDFRLPFWKLHKKLSYSIYSEPHYEYDPNIKNIKLPAYLDGYFQSYKYFSDYKPLIEHMFSFERKNFQNVVSPSLSQIINENSVCVHIRRADYINIKQTNAFHGVCSTEYYERSIEKIIKEVENPHFFFFSDDISWVKQIFSNLNVKKTFVNENFGSESWKDMYYMSKCKHQIIANSTFSWWGAWLNNNQQKIVIAPKKWFNVNLSDKDLIPHDWVRL